jgi:hypothetical protein
MSEYTEKFMAAKSLGEQLVGLLDELKEEFGIDYKLELQTQTEDGDHVGLNFDETSDWDASWC